MKKNKKKTAKRNRYLKELEELEKNAKAKKALYYKTLLKQSSKLLKGIANFTLPFALTGAITCGCFAVFYGGLPFVQDDIKKYKYYNVICEQNEIESIETSFVRKYWFEDAITGNEMVIYTPWINDGNLYKREIITFNVKDKYDDSIMQALLNKDAEKLIELGTISSTEEESTNIPKEEEQVFYIDATLHQVDKKDIISYPESELKNIIITIVEAVITLGIGSIITYYRDFSITATINDVKFYIKDAYREYDESKKKLDEKRLVLSKKGGL